MLGSVLRAETVSSIVRSSMARNNQIVEHPPIRGEVQTTKHWSPDKVEKEHNCTRNDEEVYPRPGMMSTRFPIPGNPLITPNAIYSSNKMLTLHIRWVRGDRPHIREACTDSVSGTRYGDSPH